MSIACHGRHHNQNIMSMDLRKSINVTNEDYGDVLARALHIESVLQNIHATNWVIIRGPDYRVQHQ